MNTDRYGLPLSTTSDAAATAYRAGVDCLLSANAGGAAHFERAIEADPEFALAHAGLARAHQLYARAVEARAAIRRAEALVAPLSHRERQHVGMLGKLVDGQGAAALDAARAHLAEFPRDAMVLAPCTAVFGLIGFSGRREREAELANLLAGLAPHYGDDGWFLGVHAFALSETGQLASARQLLERSLALEPRNANAAHFHAHLLYEEGASDAGLAYLTRFLADYPREAILHCHLNWHCAMWLQEAGRVDEAWNVYREHVRPGASWGPPLNTLSDAASFLWQAELGGEPRAADEWTCVAQYAPTVFPKPGIAFADVHAMLAFAASGQRERFDPWRAMLEQLRSDERLPASDVVAVLADGWQACANADWDTAAALLARCIAEHPRIGGSRAQRDLIEQTLLFAARRAGACDPAIARIVRPRAHARFRDPMPQCMADGSSDDGRTAGARTGGAPATSAS